MDRGHGSTSLTLPDAATLREPARFSLHSGDVRNLVRCWRSVRVWALNVVLAVVWLWFAKTHLAFWLDTGDPRGVGAMALEAVVAVLFLTRRQSVETTLKPIAWGATIVGTLGPMLLRPTTSGGGLVPLVLQLTGAAFAVVSLLALGRSFGLVAANRGLVARGPYAIVRHPAYLGYLVTQVGYVLENPSVRNATIVVAATIAQLVRIRFEEGVLGHDPLYAAYKERVRFRLIPLVY